MLALAVRLATAAEAPAIDAELLRPAYAADAIPGWDTPLVRRGGAVRAGLLVQFERNPLYLYDGNSPVSPLVENRITTYAGASVDLSKRFAARLVVPWVAQFGQGAEGGGAGDVSAGVKLEIYDTRRLALGARVDVLFPVGSPGLYASEAGVRAHPGATAMLRLGRVDFLSDVGFLIRSPVETADELNLDSELTWNLGVAVDTVPKRLRLYVGALSRVPLAGNGAVPVELLGGGTLHLSRTVDLDLAAGRGITGGYGTTSFRGLLSASFHWAPPKPAPVVEPVARTVDTARLLDIEDLAEPATVAQTRDLPLARVEQKQIVIRDPIQFEVATDAVVAESLPTLAAVAKLMNENADIAQLVIEGHASDDGDHAFNYDLSVRRTLAVYRALVEAGVHPTRLSCRAWGEVAPAIAGDQAANRRVMFHIARRLVPGEANAGWETSVTLPWSGEVRTIPGPPVPPPSPEEEE